uniref:Integrase catalytic domain-containing protein n=1 Tax=Panagrolaimus sp. ES5 TaxID=591445 RepID=A0AC34FDI0_9BILA
MSDRLQVNLQRTYNEVLEIREEYDQLLSQHRIPWSTEISIEMGSLLQIMKQSHQFLLDSLDKWEDISKKIKDPDQRKAEYELLDTWRDNDEHRKLMTDLTKILLKGEKYLQMEVDDTDISIRSDSTQTTRKIEFTATVPLLNLPKFNGDYLKWSPFWQRFQHAVHSKPYPKIEKLISLLGYLEGKALDEVEGFTVAEENYDTIVETLHNRFGKKSLIILELQAKLRGIQPAKSDPESFRNTVNTICNMCRQLQNLGVDVNNYAVKMDIIEKLPFQEKRELKWLLISDSERTTIEKLMEKMKEMALKAELIPEKKQYFEPKNSNYVRPACPNSNDSDLFNKTVTVNKFKCSLCDDSHLSSKCPKFVLPEEKLKQLRSRNYCTHCSSKNHDAKSCRSKIVCRICDGNHYQFLCTSKHASNLNRSTAFISVEKKQGMLLTKEIMIVNPVTKETTEAVAIFDSGSQKSYISNALMKQLKLQIIQEEELHVVGFAAKASKYNSALVNFQIKTSIGDYKEIFANSTKKIATTVPVVYADKFESNDIKIVNKTPDILIGMDYFLQFITSFEKADDDIYIVNSIVGKMICKNVLKTETTTVTSLAIDEPQNIIEDENDLQKFWRLEDLGIKDSVEDEEQILEKFKQNVKFEDRRYYVSWPEKEDHDELPTNAGLALGRLKSTFRRYSHIPEFLNDCGKIIAEQEARGTVEVAPKIPDGKLVHYLSSHAVITPEKTTTKVRMVFDASAKISKYAPSLNDCLIRGPLNMPDLGGILLRIRRGKYMLVGDIEKAFHQIYLNKKDRDAVRFFWAKDPSKPITNDNLIVYRFIGVPFGVISSPFILWIIILLHLKKLNIEELRNIAENFYVDNLFLLVDDIMKGIKQFETIRNHFLQASMNIREWLSNDSQINQAFPENIRQKDSTTKILGLKWNSEADTLQVELKNTCDTTLWTKRKVLKFIASTFDPLGFLSPVTVKGRCFMQKLFKEKLTWDEPLNENLSYQWKLILKDWNGTIKVPRKYTENSFPDNDQVEIHAFADASQQAYCTCIYLRIKTSNGYETPLIFAKTRLQPVNKVLTIPKLEIMGIWLAGKIITYVSKQMKLEGCKRYIWTDSQISFYWFQKSPKNVFVTNRLKEVLKSEATCRFVPGHLNPADLGTRGISFEDLKNSKTWWNGPAFLKQKCSEWPKSPAAENDLNQTIIALAASAETVTLQNIIINREFEIDTNLSFFELKQFVAGKLHQKQIKDIIATDLKDAEKHLIRQEQQILVKPKDIKEFKLMKDQEDLYRMNCRFDHAEMINPNPIFLPKTSTLTRIIIQHVHEVLHHAGIPHTLSKIREAFWIPSGRSMVKQAIGKCKSCKYWKGKSFALPQMPSLPSSRVNVSKPFQNAGIDYCGPFKIKGNKEKVWICLFTCFTTRLVHVEPVTSMNSEDFLSAFRRFVARRGSPSYVLSDNAKQFKTAASALDEIWINCIKDENTVRYCNENAIIWDYITERAPWKGGLYERMVGLIKNALKQTIGRCFINFVEFWTFLCEVESTVNSRPLTYVHAKESFVIRPIDFVSPGIQINLPTVTVDNENDDPLFLPTTSGGGERLLEQYKRTTHHLNKFWNLWNKDYLNFLRERNINEHRNGRGAIKRQPRIDEIVLVYEPDIARGLWKTAKVIELIHSKDNEVRAVKIEYKDGFTTRRAINHLYPIEEEMKDLESDTDPDQSI